MHGKSGLRHFGLPSTMPTLHIPLCYLLGCRYPVMRAPMAGGPTTPELVAAVSEAGGQ
jgi:NAD(P)H-dependent flavin oxidoreductase YrpB (nitropropane dioxygenase family)